MIRKLQTKYIFYNIQGNFVELFLKKCKQKTMAEIKSFLSHINIPKLYEDKPNFVRKI